MANSDTPSTRVVSSPSGPAESHVQQTPVSSVGCPAAPDEQSAGCPVCLTLCKGLPFDSKASHQMFRKDRVTVVLTFMAVRIPAVGCDSVRSDQKIKSLAEITRHEMPRAGL
ncbi:hypothetical protein RRG08_059158 [Elysia crispata]|uniref:Uncharacterized protein n=1 Tax=Elysia crispata TaxID=231223 RepID=A0AAE1DMN2_9GAST|nr:hypothetical protein RRG08_059158 [Elysia crispata]